MNAISFSRRRLAEREAAERESVAIYDVDACIRSWGRRGILIGGLTGLVLGAIFVANPFAAGVLTFGIAGTLTVCAIECAVIAGGFGVLMAALHGQRVSRGSTNGLERTLATGRSPAGADWRGEEVFLPEVTQLAE